MSWMNGEFCPSCTKQQCVRSGAERQCAASCATTTQARAARTETRCYARKCTTRQTTVARARAQRQAGMALRSKAGAQTNPGKGSSHSNALRYTQVHHPPDNGGASTRCAQRRRCGQKREPKPKPAGLGAAGVVVAGKKALLLRV